MKKTINIVPIILAIALLSYATINKPVTRDIQIARNIAQCIVTSADCDGKRLSECNVREIRKQRGC